MSDCFPHCEPYGIEFDLDQAWCSACGHGWFMRRTAEGHPLGWAPSAYRKRVP